MGAIAGMATVLIFCLSAIKAYDMYICSDKKIKMYADPNYEGRIEKLEEEVKLLKEKENK